MMDIQSYEKGKGCKEEVTQDITVNKTEPVSVFHLKVCIDISPLGQCYFQNDNKVWGKLC